MKKIFALICAAALPFAGYADDDVQTTQESTPSTQVAPTTPAPVAQPEQSPVVNAMKVALKIEPLSPEQSQAGITNDLLQSIVQKKLEEAGISIDATVQQPTLILRVRSIQTGLDIATFFQLSLLEDSMLVRNRSMFQAITWSQASLLACRPEDLKKEVVETVDMMSQSFAKDYVKALQM